MEPQQYRVRSGAGAALSSTPHGAARFGTEVSSRALVPVDTPGSILPGVSRGVEPRGVSAQLSDRPVATFSSGEALHRNLARCLLVTRGQSTSEQSCGRNAGTGHRIGSRLFPVRTISSAARFPYPRSSSPGWFPRRESGTPIRNHVITSTATAGTVSAGGVRARPEVSLCSPAVPKSTSSGHDTRPAKAHAKPAARHPRLRARCVSRKTRYIFSVSARERVRASEKWGKSLGWMVRSTLFANAARES